ncbi:alpha-amylase [Mesonia phycicola]|uniref:Alpha-amylase n=1 Tax=Mesonia phycicola TaxID=579105 RepID=A0A1M6DVH4_9FLAO|nr:alpha-amylase [Mesonia phycicola]SHI77129.1 alpha-amylase [Mesonia phycicola]
MKKNYLLATLAFCIVCIACSSDDFTDTVSEENLVETTTDLTPTTNSISTGTKVMMQAFYWDVPAGGTWWNTVSTKVQDWNNAGIDAIWLPPISKAQNGPFSMGYDPFDYFDFGEYNQMGSTETRFGSRQELESLIQNAHQQNLAVIADIVINHNSGGDLESNTYTGTDTYTDFNPASGKFYRSATDFHPNDTHSNDTGIFGGYPDMCHNKSYVQDWLYKQSYSVAQYYKDTLGIDGWRFDYVKGYEPWVVNAWTNEVGGFAVGEYWDANVDLLNNWTNDAQASAFDFACYYRMKDAFDGNDLTKLQENMLWKRNPMRAVTFVSNHDTNEIYNGKMLAYAYILTHEGYPCVFYQDYEEWLDKSKLNNLIWIHNNKAGGSTDILHVDQDEYIARRNGSPGLVVYLNNSDSWQERWIQTNWYGSQIKDYTGNSNWEPYTQSNGWVKIQSPPNSYSIWSTK